ncbi:hypothetical protein GYA37_01780 [candidate division WWE3 bacterium]|uniref:Uncharacterized protein n=1 Tax=candidate division WWE3 bacterium TaxID=2053526 RepID=A0A7X9E6V8_UNCKA|nr:hypothetical protein [candidate division WWE3 bacterium]
MKIRLELERKHKYLIQSLLSCVFIYITTQNVVSLTKWHIGVLMVILVVSGSYVSHYPNIHKENFLVSVLMPLGVLSGALLSLHFFPNLSFIFKLLVIAFFGFVYYLVSLSDNIFLVVHDREETIPLYRVAVTWSQILQVVVAIPLFAGIFKINTNAFVQCFLVSFFSFLCAYYQLWIYQFDQDAKRTGVGEILFLSFSTFFFMYVTTFAVSFFPTEAFLRASFSSSVLLFALSYISGHLKNEISRKMIVGYLVIILVSLITLLVFTS